MNSCYGFLAGLATGTLVGAGISMMMPKQSKQVKCQMEDSFSRFGSAMEQAMETMMDELHQG